MLIEINQINRNVVYAGGQEEDVNSEANAISSIQTKKIQVFLLVSSSPFDGRPSKPGPKTEYWSAYDAEKNNRNLANNHNLETTTKNEHAPEKGAAGIKCVSTRNKLYHDSTIKPKYQIGWLLLY